MLGTNVVSIVLAGLVALPAAAQDTTKVALTTDKPVYKAGVSGNVLIRFKSVGPAVVKLKHANSWRIYNAAGTKLIFAGSAIPIPIPLSLGQEKVWTWNKKDCSGKFVKPGSYLVRVDFLNPAGQLMSRSRRIALTPTGTLAGSSMFPLSEGNEWVFSPTDNSDPITTRVISKKGQSYLVKNFLDANRWVQKSDRTLLTSLQPSGPLKPLFLFGWGYGSRFFIDVAGMWKMWVEVGSTNETVVTPAGTFLNCYRLDVEYPFFSLVGQGYKSFYFAPGVGLVQYVAFSASDDEDTTYRLHHAKIRALDGKVYRIGQR